MRSWSPLERLPDDRRGVDGDPRRPSRSEMWDRYEMAVYGKTGNTFEQSQVTRLDAFFDWLAGSEPADGQPSIQTFYVNRDVFAVGPEEPWPPTWVSWV